MYYGEILRELREEKKLNQKDLGKELNVNQITISQYERGTRALSIEMLIKYADYFNVTTDYILCRDKKNKVKEETQIDKIEENINKTEEKVTKIEKQINNIEKQINIIGNKVSKGNMNFNIK
ncbi:MAG: helix-turn-helix domain-containing protein [Lachnospirales bacterium]